jgi:hypothetical protein
MSDQGTDSFVGVVAILAVVAALVTAAGGGGASGVPASIPSPTATLKPTVGARTATASSNIPGGPLTKCRGTVISDRTSTSATSGDLTLKVFYDPANGGQNCAIATRSAHWSGPPGQLVITLRFADYDGRRWPRLATHRSDNYAMRSGAVYLNNTDDRCVSARARLVADSARESVSVSTGRIGCD